MPYSLEPQPSSSQYVPMAALQAGIQQWDAPASEVGQAVLWDSLQSFADQTERRGVWAPPEGLSVALDTLHARAVQVDYVPTVPAPSVLDTYY